jgi:3-hydroxyacyl-CoA dehydrogenase
VSNVLTLSCVKERGVPLASNASASVWDIGASVACLEFHSKMNTIDLDTIAMAAEAVAIASRSMCALVIHNEAKHFSVGANLGMFVKAASAGDFDAIDMMIARGQNMIRAFKFSAVPVVAAPAGLALGGGCEVVLHCTAVHAHTTVSMGLVEPLVGLIPGWGGCKEVLLRKSSVTSDNSVTPILEAFNLISSTIIAKSVEEAQGLNLLRHHDGVVSDTEQLLSAAKHEALRLAQNHVPPKPFKFQLPWKTAREALFSLIETNDRAGKYSSHDVTVFWHLASVLAGGNCEDHVVLTEDDVMELERQHFVELCKTPETLARMQAMLETGKPLRN